MTDRERTEAETATDSGLAGARSSTPVLRLLLGAQGELDGRIIRLPSSRFVIGRPGQAGVGLALPDPKVSREHAEVLSDGGVFLLRDRSSRNGTFVNGVQVREQVLKSQDVLRIGRSLLVFDVAEG